MAENLFMFSIFFLLDLNLLVLSCHAAGFTSFTHTRRMRGTAPRNYIRTTIYQRHRRCRSLVFGFFCALSSFDWFQFNRQDMCIFRHLFWHNSISNFSFFSRSLFSSFFHFCHFRPNNSIRITRKWTAKKKTLFRNRIERVKSDVVDVKIYFFSALAMLAQIVQSAVAFMRTNNRDAINLINDFNFDLFFLV